MIVNLANSCVLTTNPRRPCVIATNHCKPSITPSLGARVLRAGDNAQGRTNRRGGRFRSDMHSSRISIADCMWC